MRHRLAIWFVLVTVLAASASFAGSERAQSGASLRVIEGVVIGLGERIGEGDLAVVSIEVSGDGESVHLLLAPRAALDDISFRVEKGDLVRARSFEPDASGAAYVQKIMNVTRSGMVRLRTLRSDPLWDSNGRWQGSRDPHHRGGDRSGTGRRYRGGR
jgi:hypothetical protein